MTQADKLIRLYYDNQQKIASYAVSITGNVDDAHDAIQDVLVSFVARGASLPPLENQIAYLYTCVRQSAFRVVQKRNRAILTDFSTDVSQVAFDDNMFETKDYVEAQLSSCTPEMREMFLRYIFDGYSSRELAKEYGLSPNTASKRISRMRDLIRTQTLLYTLLFNIFS